MQEVSDYELLELALGGNWLRLTLDRDEYAKHTWLTTISFWKQQYPSYLSWCKQIGGAWDQTPFFHGITHDEKNSIVVGSFCHLFHMDFARLGYLSFSDIQRCLDFLKQTNYVCIPRHESPIYKHKLEHMVCNAIRCWNLLSLRFRVPKDLRQKIANLIWISRSEWI